MEIGKKDIEFLGYKISKGRVILQEHVLKVFANFPDQILEKVQLQRFLGSLNYIRPFYKGQADDIHLLQQRLKKNPPRWNKDMTDVVNKIKEKVKQLPPLLLPQVLGQMVIETYASNKSCGGILIEEHGYQKEICGYAS